MPRAPIPPPALYLHAGMPAGKATIGSADNGRLVTIPRTFTARFDLEGVGLVDLVVEAEDGRVRVSSLQVVELDGAGVDGVTLAGIPLRKLLERAATQMAKLSGVGSAALPAAAKASRRRVSDERLRGVADAYIDGGISAVMELELVGERQAWRLKAEAAKKGFIPEEGSDGER